MVFGRLWGFKNLGGVVGGLFNSYVGFYIGPSTGKMRKNENNLTTPVEAPLILPTAY